MHRADHGVNQNVPLSHASATGTERIEEDLVHVTLGPLHLQGGSENLGFVVRHGRAGLEIAELLRELSVGEDAQVCEDC